MLITNVSTKLICRALGVGLISLSLCLTPAQANTYQSMIQASEFQSAVVVNTDERIEHSEDARANTKTNTTMDDDSHITSKLFGSE